MVEINKELLKKRIVDVLSNIFDPEIPVNIYQLGLIYEINIDENFEVKILMTLTTPNCPVADSLLSNVKESVTNVPGVRKANVELTFDPPWDMNMLPDDVKLELGIL